MSGLELLGYAAGLLTTIAFFPQVLKTWRTRSTQDISLVMFSTFTLGVLLWAIYGVLLQSWPIIIANSITFTLSLTILSLKIRHG